jgi:hypothetical protein
MLTMKKKKIFVFCTIYLCRSEHVYCRTFPCLLLVKFYFLEMNYFTKYTRLMVVVHFCKKIYDCRQDSQEPVHC